MSRFSWSATVAVPQSLPIRRSRVIAQDAGYVSALREDRLHEVFEQVVQLHRVSPNDRPQIRGHRRRHAGC
jgi:hypothetical protein